MADLKKRPNRRSIGEEVAGNDTGGKNRRVSLENTEV